MTCELATIAVTQGSSASIAELEAASATDLGRQDIPQPPSRVDAAPGGVFSCYGLRKTRANAAVGWGHMPHDILVAIVRLAGPADARACHRVCRAWHHAVRCGTDALTPSAKHCAFPRIRQCFPRVVKLHLHQFSLGERDAMHLAGLQQLRALHLDQVAFEAPGATLKLTALQGLRRLEMTDLKGMPSETDAFLRSLSGLTCLRVSFTSPCTKLPPMHCLSDLVSLKELSLSESLHFMVPGLASVGALSDLRSLSMERVGVTNGVLRALGGLTRLRALHLPDAFRATDAGIAHLCALTGLTRLDLSAPGSRRDEALTDAGIGALAPLGALRSLSLAGHAELTAEGLSFLSACTALTALDLSETALELGGCDFLAHLEQLQRLSLERTLLGHAQLCMLAQLTRLTSLNLAWCPATDETAAALSGLAQMQALDLRFCAITNTGMQALSAGMPALRRVVIDGCPLTSLGVWRLLMAHKRLCLWSPAHDRLHRAMNVADALLLCSAAPGARRLRVARHPEASWPATFAVTCGVASFFVFYFGLLLLFFTALFMFPIFMLGCICVAVCLAFLGVRYLARGLRRLWAYCDYAFSTFLLGHQAHVAAAPVEAQHFDPQHPNAHQQHPAHDELPV